MARVVSPLMSLQAAGSVGGVTVAPFRNGFRMTAKAKPVTRIVSGLPEVRVTLSYLARKYETLTPAQKSAWTQWGLDHPRSDSLGQTYYPTGFQAFVSLNSVAMTIGGVSGYSADPPTQNLQYAVTNFAAATGITLPGDVDLTWTVLNTGSADDFVEIKMGRAHASSAIVDPAKKQKFQTSTAGNVELTTVSDLIEEMWYWFAARYVGADGQVSPWVVSQATPMVTP